MNLITFLSCRLSGTSKKYVWFETMPKSFNITKFKLNANMHFTRYHWILMVSHLLACICLVYILGCKCVFARKDDVAVHMCDACMVLVVDFSYRMVSNCVLISD